MAHELASALQNTMGISNLSATKEPDINVSFEHIDVAECRIIYARSRVTVMQYLSNVVSARAHDLKPALCDLYQLTGMFVHPVLDRWISLNRSWKPHQLAHGNFISRRGSSITPSEKRREELRCVGHD
jgi:hypothetical protein